MLAIPQRMPINKRIDGKLMVCLSRSPNAHNVPLVVIELVFDLRDYPMMSIAQAEREPNLTGNKLNRNKVSVLSVIE
jgi:hypothetical protein